MRASYVRKVRHVYILYNLYISIYNLQFIYNLGAGEPPICMSVVVLFALRYAINSARKDAGLPVEWVPLGKYE